MVPYIGSGPYCYANSLAMVLGPGAPAPAVIEVLTGSPFGFCLLGDRLPLFDPYGWDPDLGLDDAIGRLGWTCSRRGADGPAAALELLRTALEAGPALAGPMEMGLFRHQPGMTAPIEADHFVAVLAADDERVRFHDPHGHPFATLPTGAFLAAWRGETIAYRSTEYTIRFGFSRDREVSPEGALREARPAFAAWLRGRADLAPPPGTVGGAEAVHRLADRVGAGLPDDVLGFLTWFAVRVGARRLADAAAWHTDEAAEILENQAMLVGELQYALVNDDRAGAERTLRALAPTYERLAGAL
ncbi:hypothetical protein ACPPVO_13515 [Dactylosporangium sp. McL0621]|uniref:hypothetical protein n=1 Tax=Dactylosporangium sp. McL0621 TaxID=3415678 RepID=UPI003CEF5E5D